MLLQPLCPDFVHGNRKLISLQIIQYPRWTTPLLQALSSLELLSYEDISDVELAPLANCPVLRHLYVDSLFIKMVREGGEVDKRRVVCAVSDTL